MAYGIGDLTSQDWGFQEWQTTDMSQPYASWAKSKGYGVPDTSQVTNYLSTGSMPNFYDSASPNVGTGNSNYQFTLPEGYDPSTGRFASQTPTAGSPSIYNSPSVPTAPTGANMAPAPYVPAANPTVDSYGTGNNQTTGAASSSSSSSSSGGLDWSNLGDPYGISTSTSYSGLNPELYGQLTESLSGVQDLLPLYGQAMGGLMDLPQNIDSWTNNLINQYKVGGDDIVNTMNAVAQDRMGKGIMGGTETENLRSNMLSQLLKDTNDKRAEALQNAIGYKTGAITAAPDAAQMPYQALTSLLGLGDISESNSYSYNTDPTALAGIVASLIQSNY